MTRYIPNPNDLVPQGDFPMQASILWCGTSGGSANAQTLTPTLALNAQLAGTILCFKAGYSTSGASTLNVSGLGATTLQRKGAATGAGDLTANTFYFVVFDGTNWQIIG